MGTLLVFLITVFVASSIGYLTVPRDSKVHMSLIRGLAVTLITTAAALLIVSLLISNMQP